MSYRTTQLTEFTLLVRYNRITSMMSEERTITRLEKLSGWEKLIEMICQHPPGTLLAQLWLYLS